MNVIIGNGVPQDRTKGRYFQGIPVVVNNGYTPAHKVGHRSNSMILTLPIADDFEFPIPERTNTTWVLGPQQRMEIFPAKLDFVPDDEVVEIKKGNGRAVCIWGVISYEDVFAEPRETRYCQILTWRGEGGEESLFGYYNFLHNDAT